MAVALTSLATFTSSARDRDDPDVLHVGQGLGDHVAALVEVEQRLGLLGVANRRHDDLVEDQRGALDDLEVPVMEGIEGSGDETNRRHSPPSSGSNIVTSVVP